MLKNGIIILNKRKHPNISCRCEKRGKVEVITEARGNS